MEYFSHHMIILNLMSFNFLYLKIIMIFSPLKVLEY